MNDPGKIRNIALVGHRGTGKTSLLEAMLYRSGVVNRLGTVQDGTTVSDFDDDEKKRQLSLSATLATIERKGVLFNLIDTPGDPSFQADTIAALRVVETALVVVNSVNGVEVQTERLWARAEERGLARILLCNMLDRERADFDTAVAALQQAFGQQVVAVQLPIGSEHTFNGVVDLLAMKAYTVVDGKASEGQIPADLADRAAELRDKLTEAVAETDDALIEKYLEGRGDQRRRAVRRRSRAAVKQARLFPVAAGSATHLVGARAAAGAARRGAVAGRSAGAAGRPAQTAPASSSPATPAGRRPLWCSRRSPTSSAAASTCSASSRAPSRATATWRTPGTATRSASASLLKPMGKEQKPIDALVAGDIGAVAKLKDVLTGDALCAEGLSVTFAPFEFPAPLMSQAVTAKSKGDEDKVISSLRRLSEEDPMMSVQRDPQTGEMIVSGMSQVHIEVISERIKRRFGVEVDLHPPRVPYRETIKAASKAQGRHKKQTGGRGQFGDTWIELQPMGRGEGFEFVDKIVGGVIPRNYIPAVEKGIVEAMHEGFVAGYPVVDFRAILYDGSHHPVDSSEMAFKIAGSLGFKKAMEKAQPVILEPIMSVDVTVPEENVGDIMGDLNSRRGRVLGSTPRGHYTVINAEVPLAEMLSYAPVLTSMTGGRGDYSMEFLRYEEVPAHLAGKIVDEQKKAREEAH